MELCAQGTTRLDMYHNKVQLRPEEMPILKKNKHRNSGEEADDVDDMRLSPLVSSGSHLRHGVDDT